MGRLSTGHVGTLMVCSALIISCSSVEASGPAPSGGSVGFAMGGGGQDSPGVAGGGGAPGGTGGLAGGGTASAGAPAALPQAGAGGSSAVVDPVHVVHGFLPNDDWLTIVIQGYGMAAYDGLPVYVRLGELARTEWSRCWGAARIVAGGFSITLPDCDEIGIYKRRLAFIDLNQDGICNEIVYGTNAAVREDTTFTLSDSAPPPPAPQAMDTLFTEGDCAVFNEQWGQ